MKYLTYLPFDCSTVANYVSWASGIGTALGALGWTKSTDTGQVNWANVATVAPIAPTAQSFTLIGAWAGGQGYIGVANIGALSGVTNAGLTYQCILGTSSGGGITASPNVSLTFTITAVAASSSQQAIYTVSSTPTGALGQQFVVTIGGSNLAANNAGTYVCTASTTTTVTLANAGATLQASVTGGSPGAQMISSTGITTFSVGATSVLGTSAANSLVGHSVMVSGFAVPALGNNGTFTVLASGGDQSGKYYFSVSLAGTSGV